MGLRIVALLAVGALCIGLFGESVEAARTVTKTRTVTRDLGPASVFVPAAAVSDRAEVSAGNLNRVVVGSFPAPARMRSARVYFIDSRGSVAASRQVSSSAARCKCGCNKPGCSCGNGVDDLGGGGNAPRSE